MDITLNGQTHQISKPPYSLEALLETLNLSKKPIIIEHNLTPLNKEKWAQTQLKQNDKLEIITLAAGG